MPSAFGGFARGLGAGVELGDRIQGRQDDLELRRAANERAERGAALAEEQGQLANQGARREQEYQQANKAFVDQWMNEKDKDGKPIEWDAKREFDYGAAKVKFDSGWGKLTAKDQMQFAEMKKKFDDKEVTDAFGKLVSGDQKGAAPFLKKMGLKSAQISRDPKGSWMMQGVDEDGNQVSVPAGLIGATVGFPLTKAIKDEADVDLTRAQTGLANKRAELVGTAQAATETERELTRQGNEVAKLFTTTENTLRQEAVQLAKDEEKIDPNASPEEKAAKKKEFAEKRRNIEVKAQKVFRDKADIGTIMDASKEMKVNKGKGLSAARAHGILEEAARGTDNIIIKEDNTAHYLIPGTKTLIPLPAGAVPQSVYDKQRGGAAPAPAAEPAAPAAAAAPARNVRPFAEREAEANAWNARFGGRRAIP